MPDFRSRNVKFFSGEDCFIHTEGKKNVKSILGKQMTLNVGKNISRSKISKRKSINIGQAILLRLSVPLNSSFLHVFMGCMK